MITLIEVTSDSDYQIAVQLFREYAVDIGIDLEFQHFSKEIETIKSQYARPEGVLFIAHHNTHSVSGCVGIRALEGEICELKRMYVKTEARGLGIGKHMLEKSIAMGKELGYQKMRLDTLSTMHTAIGLYKKMGFYEIKPYRFNPFSGAKYFEIGL
ncbi:MAG: GNAT family N-acetyltransferase [Bacteroidota bacterium]